MAVSGAIFFARNSEYHFELTANHTRTIKYGLKKKDNHQPHEPHEQKRRIQVKSSWGSGGSWLI
jgi:hypothetical protein